MSEAIQPIHRTVSIMVIEDDPGDVEVLRAMLRFGPGFRFDVDHRPTLQSGVRQISTRPPDLIILDLGLPDARDLEGLSRIQAVAPGVPVVVLTGRGDDEMALQAVHQGAEDFLVKGDLDRRHFQRALRYAMERNRSRRDLAILAERLSEANARLSKIALVDPLTELLNRRGLQESLSRVLQSMNRDGIPAMALLIDLDDFKRINDQLGLAVGDVVLKEVADRIRGAVRGMDYVSRIGGDEFVLVLPKADPEEGARIADRIRLAISAFRIQLGDRSIRVTGSFAVMMLSPETAFLDDILLRTHRLLKKSKSAGKNRVTVDGSLPGQDRGSSRASDLCAALVGGEGLFAVKQPILDIGNEEIVGWEMLSRYANGRTEMPTHFFRLCAEQSVLTPVDHRCFRNCAEAAKTLPRGIRRHINLFPSTLLAITAERLVREVSGFAEPGDLCVELSEQQILGEPSHLIEPVHRLTESGMRVAVDDVGFGATCLESLLLLEPEVIKIDRRCVTGIDRDPRGRERLGRLLDVCNRLAPEVIVEGVETNEQLEVLRDLPVRLAQGFLWGRPA